MICGVVIETAKYMQTSLFYSFSRVHLIQNEQWSESDRLRHCVGEKRRRRRITQDAIFPPDKRICLCNSKKFSCLLFPLSLLISLSSVFFFFSLLLYLEYPVSMLTHLRILSQMSHWCLKTGLLRACSTLSLWLQTIAHFFGRVRNPKCLFLVGRSVGSPYSKITHTHGMVVRSTRALGWVQRQRWRRLWISKTEKDTFKKNYLLMNR